jgi:hypothetical protein
VTSFALALRPRKLAIASPVTTRGSAKSGDAPCRARKDTGAAPQLRLRPVTEADEDVVLRADEALDGDGFKFAGGYGPERTSAGPRNCRLRLCHARSSLLTSSV